MGERPPAAHSSEHGWLSRQGTLTGRCLFAAAVARPGRQVLVVQKGSGEHQGKQVEEVIVAGDDDQDLQQDLGRRLCSELRPAPPTWPFGSCPALPRSSLQASRPFFSISRPLSYPHSSTSCSYFSWLPNITLRKAKFSTPHAPADRSQTPSSRAVPCPRGTPSHLKATRAPACKAF